MHMMAIRISNAPNRQAIPRETPIASGFVAERLPACWVFLGHLLALLFGSLLSVAVAGKLLRSECDQLLLRMLGHGASRIKYGRTDLQDSLLTGAHEKGTEDCQKGHIDSRQRSKLRLEASSPRWPS